MGLNVTPHKVQKNAENYNQLNSKHMIKVVLDFNPCFFYVSLLHCPSQGDDGAKSEALNEGLTLGHCNTDVNMVMGLDQDIHLGRMLIDAFHKCDEL